MNVRRLALTNFRNWRHLELELAPAVSILVGANGEGKTNILEALYLASTGRSHRTSRDAELVAWGEQSFHVRVEVQRRAGDARVIEVAASREGRKRVRINRVEQERVGSLLGNLPATLFSPEDVNLVRGAPVHRRRFLDLGVCQGKPQHYHHLQMYYRALAQKNALLRRGPDRRTAREDIAPWNEQLLAYGAVIGEARLALVERLGEFAPRVVAHLGGGSRLELRYVSSAGETGMDREEIARAYARAMRRAEPEELARRVCLVGPHRDDLSLRLDGVDVRTYGSQGQQRVVAVGLKLAEFEVLRSELREAPLLLLDDVLSELDDLRRARLLGLLDTAGQTIITATSAAQLGEGAASRGFTLWHVADGAVRRQ